MAKQKNQFGSELRRMRRAKGLSLVTLADAIGCSIVHMSDIERGHKNPPSPDKIAKLLKAVSATGELERMQALAILARRSIEIRVGNDSPSVTDMLVALARRCDEGSLDEGAAKKIRRILEEEKPE